MRDNRSIQIRLKSSQSHRTVQVEFIHHTARAGSVGGRRRCRCVFPQGRDCRLNMPCQLYDLLLCFLQLLQLCGEVCNVEMTVMINLWRFTCLRHARAGNLAVSLQVEEKNMEDVYYMTFVKA